MWMHFTNRNAVLKLSGWGFAFHQPDY